MAMVVQGKNERHSMSLFLNEFSFLCFPFSEINKKDDYSGMQRNIFLTS